MSTAGYSFFIDRVISVCLRCAAVHRDKRPFKDPGSAIFFKAECIAAQKCFVDFNAVKSGIAQECHRVDQRMLPEEILQ